MIAKNAPLPAVLTRLVLFMESQLHRIRGSILLARRGPRAACTTARRRACRAPITPPSTACAIGPKVGSCGTAAYRRETVIVADIQTDPLWEDYRELAARFGLRSCWSTPILSHEGRVLGTFAMYSDEVRDAQRRRDCG